MEKRANRQNTQDVCPWNSPKLVPREVEGDYMSRRSREFEVRSPWALRASASPRSGRSSSRSGGAEGSRRATEASGSLQEIPANEETPFNPCDLYQETKLEAEQQVWRVHGEEGLPITVIRPISMFGPGDRRVLKLFRMIRNGWVPVIGSGEVYFQPAYVDDVVAAFLAALDNPNAIGEAHIVGGDEYVTLNELFAVVAEVLHVRLRRIRIPLAPVLLAARLCEAVCVPLGIEPPLHRRRVSFYQNNRAFAVDKAKRELDFQPSVSLREGLRRTAEWYRANDWL
jgi:dihydroflavonol-4-reductase